MDGCSTENYPNLSKNGFRIFGFHINKDRWNKLSINAQKNRSGLKNFIKYRQLILQIRYILHHTFLKGEKA